MFKTLSSAAEDMLGEGKYPQIPTISRERGPYYSNTREEASPKIEAQAGLLRGRDTQGYETIDSSSRRTSARDSPSPRCRGQGNK